jgi:hypothetical protein
VRLAIGRTIDDTLEPSGLMLLLAARLGDPLAHGISKYLVDHPSKEFVFPLEQLGYVQAMLERLPRAPGRFAWTVGGERHVVDLRPGGSYSLVLTKNQWSTLALERLEGDLAVVTSWTSTDAQLPSDPAVSITRVVTPAGNAPDDRLVRVRLEVRFGPAAPGGCYRVTDLLPSGLAPVAGPIHWEGDFEEIFSFPYQSGDQRVSWCAYPDTKRSAVLPCAARASRRHLPLEQAVIKSEESPHAQVITPARRTRSGSAGRRPTRRRRSRSARRQGDRPPPECCSASARCG